MIVNFELLRRKRKMIANVKLIEVVLQKYTAYKIGKETGISYSTVNDWKKGITSIYYKRQSKNVQKWEFKNVQFYSLNISFKR